jgi:hypothetical protein
MTKNKTVSDEVMAAAEAASDPKALSAAAVTEKPVADGSAFDHDGDGKVGGSKRKHQPDEQPTPVEYRLAALEAQVSNLNKLVMHWQGIYQWPLPWHDSKPAAQAQPTPAPEDAERG